MPSKLPPTAVIDTNIVVSAFLFQRGTPYDVLSALYRGAFHIVISERIRQEYMAVLSRPTLIQRYNIDAASVAAYFRFLNRRGLVVAPITILPIEVRDANDEHILAAALGADVNYLVSGDDDLLSLADDARLGKLQIVTARNFLDALSLE